MCKRSDEIFYLSYFNWYFLCNCCKYKSHILKTLNFEVEFNEIWLTYLSMSCGPSLERVQYWTEKSKTFTIGRDSSIEEAYANVCWLILKNDLQLPGFTVIPNVISPLLKQDLALKRTDCRVQRSLSKQFLSGLLRHSKVLY